MTKKSLPTAIIFTHRGKEMDGLVLADKGICWQVEMSDGSTLLVQKKHVITELTGDAGDEEAHVAASQPLVDPDSVETPDPFEDEPPAADSLATMLTKIRAEGKVAPKGKQAKTPKAAPAPVKPAAKPTQAKTPSAGTGDLITLKQLCAELDVEPRIARRRLRNSVGLIGTGSRWEWKAKDKVLADIRKAIKG